MWSPLTNNSVQKLLSRAAHDSQQLVAAPKAGEGGSCPYRRESSTAQELKSFGRLRSNPHRGSLAWGSELSEVRRAVAQGLGGTECWRPSQWGHSPQRWIFQCSETKPDKGEKIFYLGKGWEMAGGTQEQFKRLGTKRWIT